MWGSPTFRVILKLVIFPMIAAMLTQLHTELADGAITRHDLVEVGRSAILFLAGVLVRSPWGDFKEMRNGNNAAPGS